MHYSSTSLLQVGSSHLDAEAITGQRARGEMCGGHMSEITTTAMY